MEKECVLCFYLSDFPSHKRIKASFVLLWRAAHGWKFASLVSWERSHPYCDPYSLEVFSLISACNFRPKRMGIDSGFYRKFQVLVSVITFWCCPHSGPWLVCLALYFTQRILFLMTSKLESQTFSYLPSSPLSFLCYFDLHLLSLLFLETGFICV